MSVLDVIMIGLGPSGIMVTLNLARNNFKVLAFDREKIILTEISSFRMMYQMVLGVQVLNLQIDPSGHTVEYDYYTSTL